MARVKGGPQTHRRHKKILKEARGFKQGRRRLIRRANESVLKARAYQYRDRRNRKRDFRRLWIQRINAAARACGSSYGRFMHGLIQSGIALDRKVLADLAVRDPEAFRSLVQQAERASTD
jgi:large subunit ribosomal protein L20